MISEQIRGLRIFSFPSKEALVTYVKNKKNILIAINAEKILRAEPWLCDLTNQHIGYADGYGAVLALRRRGITNATKIPGCELWLDIIQSCWTEKTFYLIGGTNQVINQTVQRLRMDFPEIDIAGYRDGYLRDQRDHTDLIKDIISTRPDMIFVAAGSPTQEILMQELSRQHPAFYMGLGGSFDVYVGRANRAPRWWIDKNLEWAYRLIREPRRIKRQIHLVRFVWHLIIGKL